MRLPKIKLVFDRKHKASAQKEGTIDLRVCYDNKQKFISTGISVFPKQWDEKNSCVKLRSNAAALNKVLSDITSSAISMLTEMAQANHIDLSRLSELTKPKVNDITFIEYIKRRIEKRNVSENTRERYRTFIRVFEDWKGLVHFTDITEAKVREFDEWLHRRKVNGHLMEQSTIYSYHKYLRLFIYDAVTDELVDKNPYQSKRIKIEHGEKGQIACLTQGQLAKVEKLRLVGFLDKSRDLFLFQCYTGLAFSDMQKFKLSNYSIQEDGTYLIKDKRTKTNTTYTFVLSEKAKAILDKHKGKIPKISNQKFNQYLKLIGQMIGVPTLHSHMGRSTFASTCLNKGMNTDVLKHALGHTTTLETNRYATMQDKTIKEAFEKLKTKN